MTYGQIRLRCSLLLSGIPLEIIDGWIQDRYTEILDALPWKRLEGESVFQSPSSYQAGTVAVSQGSRSVTGTNTIWTSALTGLMFRIGNSQEYYTFSCSTGTSGVLDRPYEGTTAAIVAATLAAAGSGYVVGDTPFVAGGSGLGQVQVTGVSLTGAVTGFVVLIGGNNYAIASGVATTGGTGTGFQINITAVAQSSGFAYRIDQAVFQLPNTCRILRAVIPLHDRDRPLKLIPLAQLDRMDPQRTVYGTPEWAAYSWDTTANPPIQQVELYPVPNSPNVNGSTLSHAVDYIYEPADLDSSQTGFGLLPWARPNCIIEGVQAKAAKWRADNNPAAASGYLASAGSHEQEFQKLLISMKQINNLQRGPQTLRLAEHLRRGHRHAVSDAREVNGPGNWRDGFTG